MAISDTIQSMYTNVGEVYDTITNVSLPEHKNIENIPSTIRESYLEIMNNGTDVVWDNWEKVVGEGTELTLSNTEQAPMKVLLKGNTYQDSTSGKNLFSTNYSDYNTTSDTYGYRKIVDEIPSGKYLVISLTDNDTSVTLSSSFYLMLTSDGTHSSSSRKTPISAGNISTSPANFYTNELKYISFYPKTGTSFKILLKRYKIQYELVDSTTATSYEPYTGGNPAPNPDFPMQVHTVSGDNEVEVVGKNLFDKDTMVKNGYINSSFKIITGSSTTKCIVVPCEANKTYTISKISSKRFRVGYITTSYANNVMVSGVITDHTGTSITITTGENAQYLVAYIYDSSEDTLTLETILDSIQVELGNQATDYIPYQRTTYPINLPEGMFLGSIGDYQDKFIRNSGNNLINRATCTENVALVWTTGLTFSDTNSLTSDYIKVDDNENINTNYKSQVLFYASDKTYIGALKADGTVDKSGGGDFTTFTVPSGKDIAFVRLGFRSSTNNNNNMKTVNIMVNKGNTVLPYEPYGTNEWYLEKKIGKVVLNGTQTISRVNWRVSSTSIGWLYPYSLTNNAIVDYNTNITKADKLLGSTYNDLYNMTVDNGIGTFNSNSYGLVVRVKDTTLTTATAINNYLSTNNITAYYGLATPTYTKIEGTLASQLEEVYRAKSEEGQTNISQTNDDLPFILDASALKEI